MCAEEEQLWKEAGMGAQQSPPSKSLGPPTHLEQAGECQSRGHMGSTDKSPILILFFSSPAAFEKESGLSLTEDVELS